MDSPPKIKLSGPHDYGFQPSQKGALNFARDAAISHAIPFYKQLLKAERKGPSHKIRFLIRLLAPTLLLVGILTAFIAFYQSIYSSTAFGMQSILVDSTTGPVPAGSSEYVLNASSAPTMQQWAIRAGESAVNGPVVLNLPDPTEMKTDALVFVRNTSTESYNANSVGPTVNSTVIDIEVQSPYFTDTLTDRQNKVYIAAKNAYGQVKWYPALTMSGSI